MNTGKKVLVVEDEASIRSFIIINLSRAGYEVLEAESGEAALDMLENVCFLNFNCDGSIYHSARYNKSGLRICG